MRVTLWGTRGSLAAPGVDTARYGGNTSCVEVVGPKGTRLILDAGTGVRRLAAGLARETRRVDVLLTHLHLDHIQGLGFFWPIHEAGVDVHIWGPPSTTLTLRQRLMRYLSPPLFPVHLRDLACCLHLHEVTQERFCIDEFEVDATLICHPGPTLGYRISTGTGSLAYLPDHEPALGVEPFPRAPEWTSGHRLAADVDLLIHDAQYTAAEYPQHIGWGHSCLEHALQFAMLAGVKQFVPFHHDPGHTDADIERLTAAATAQVHPPFAVTPGAEGKCFVVGERPARAGRSASARARGLAPRTRAAHRRLSAR